MAGAGSCPTSPHSGFGSFVQEPVPDDWWHLYDDERLDALVHQALAANTDLRVAAANLEKAGPASTGAGSLDTRRSSVQEDQVRATQPQLEVQHRLAVLTGQAPGDHPADVAACAREPHLAAPLPVGDGASLLRRRPDIRRAEFEVQATAERIGVVTADPYPNVSLGASLASVGALQRGFADDTFKFSLGRQAYLPVLDANRTLIAIEQTATGGGTRRPIEAGRPRRPPPTRADIRSRSKSRREWAFRDARRGCRHHAAMSSSSHSCWLLPDGRSVTMRPIAPGDLEMETVFIDGLSTEAGYNRLFSPRHPSPEEIRRWTDIDPAREVAFVVTTRTPAGSEDMLAVGRLVHDDDTPDAEFALLVGDASKRQGIGARLLSALIAAARSRGVRTLQGETLSTNAGMLALGVRHGFTARRVVGDATVTRLSLRLG
jgi:GNAT superfamily N-acetyltransferase